MRKEDEGNGYASALVAIIKILAAAVGSATLVVVSNHHPYWRRPSLGFSHVFEVVTITDFIVSHDRNRDTRPNEVT